MCFKFHKSWHYKVTVVTMVINSSCHHVLRCSSGECLSSNLCRVFQVWSLHCIGLFSSLRNWRFLWNTCNVFHFYCSMFQCVSFLPSLVPGVRSMGPGLSMSLQGIQSITQIIPTSEACWRWVDIGDMVCSLCPLNCFWVFYKTQEVVFLVFVSSSFL